VIEILKNKVGMTLFLGDNVNDILLMADCFPGLTFRYVWGNCDFGGYPVLKTIFDVCGKRIFMTHGHRYSVKSDRQRIIYAAKEAEADICLFGHTHEPDNFEIGGIHFLNPGSVNLPRGLSSCPSYGVIDIDNNVVNCSVIGIKDGCFKRIM
jgi:putative phosphoesterase